jgi:hypothetical protein
MSSTARVDKGASWKEFDQEEGRTIHCFNQREGGKMGSYCDIAPGHPYHGPYHAKEYGFPIRDDSKLFERLVLEADSSARVKLNNRPPVAGAVRARRLWRVWRVPLSSQFVRRGGFRSAASHGSPEKVSNYDKNRAWLDIR